MAVDLLQWAIQSGSPLRAGVVRTFLADNPIARRLRFIVRSTPFYAYNKEASLPGVSYRGINQKYTATRGVVQPAVERMVNFGGVIYTDEALAKRDGGAEERANQRAMMVTAATLKFQRDFFWGDSSVDPLGFDGIATRIGSGSQLIDAGTNGADISIALVQQLQSLVVGDNADKVLLMSDLQRRRLSAAVLAAAGGASVMDASKTIREFDGSPIEVIGTDNAGNQILPQTETDESDAETGSAFCVRFGADIDGQNVQGLMTSDAFTIKDVGRDENILKDMMDCEIGLGVFRGDSVARLKGLNK